MGRPPRVLLDGEGLRVDDVVAVARHGAALELGHAGRVRILAARAALDRVLARGGAVYGATRALGAKSAVAVEDPGPFQARLVRGRAVAVGPPLPAEVVRALLTARAAGLAAGGSGVSLPTAEALVALLDGPPPVVPSVGSVGAADLAILAHAVLPLLERTPLAAKDGLALISANALSTGWGALVVHDARSVLAWADASAALAMESYGANHAPLDPRVQAARPAAGQVRAAERLRTLLAGSEADRAGRARLQDPLSFRCLAPVHGAALAAVEAAVEAVEVELNAAADNPLVVAEDEEVLHVGNFHAAGLALAVGALGVALHGVAALAAGRIAHLLDERSSGLPRALTPRGGDRAGLVPLQKTVAALVGAVRGLVGPVTLDATVLSEGVEDHGSFAPQAVERAAGIVARVREVVACELLVAAQAVDLRGPRPGGRGTAAAYAVVRDLVAPLDEDRPLGPDVDRLAARLAATEAP